MYLRQKTFGMGALAIDPITGEPVGSGGCALLDGTPAPCPDVTSVTVTASPLMPGATCFLPLFPWLGSRAAEAPSVCVPLFTVPSPWALLITVGLGGLVAYKLSRGMLR
jgi:hypothetical protein